VGREGSGGQPYVRGNAKLAYTDSLLEKYGKLSVRNALHDA
jgi:hypothetical protein